MPSLTRCDRNMISTDRSKYLVSNKRRFDFTDQALWRINPSRYLSA